MANIEHLYRLAVLYRGDYPKQLSVTDARTLLNRVAWDLKEAGWGLVPDSVRTIANLPMGQVLELLGDDGQIRALGALQLADDDSLPSRFEDPTEPDAVNTVEPITGSPFTAAGEIPVPEPIPVPDGPRIIDRGDPGEPEPPADLLEALQAVEQRVIGLSNMWQEIVREIGIILDRSNDELTTIREQLDRGFSGRAYIMGIPVSITIRPVPAPPASAPEPDPELDTAPVDTKPAQ